MALQCRIFIFITRNSSKQQKNSQNIDKHKFYLVKLQYHTKYTPNMNKSTLLTKTFDFISFILN